jgi:hypothetical protein
VRAAAERAADFSKLTNEDARELRDEARFL